jgi:hypothetical protein
MSAPITETFVREIEKNNEDIIKIHQLMTSRRKYLYVYPYPKVAAIIPTTPVPAPSSITFFPSKSFPWLKSAVSKYFDKTNAASHTTELGAGTGVVGIMAATFG